jgi:hypothetical protein
MVAFGFCEGTALGMLFGLLGVFFLGAAIADGVNYLKDNEKY